VADAHGADSHVVHARAGEAGGRAVHGTWGATLIVCVCVCVCACLKMCVCVCVCAFKDVCT